MKIFRDLHSLGTLPSPEVGIGNFDGVHRGHLHLLRTVLKRARSAAGTAVAMTFDPHPLSILSPAGRPPLITPLEEKLRLIEEIGVDVLLVVPFTREFAALTAEAFVEEVLVRQIAAHRVYVGANFHFGRGGLGDPDTLTAVGMRYGVDVERVEVVPYDSRPISSTRIRSKIQHGAMERVTAMLGREYALAGRGVEGRHRGKTLGFSTANLTTENELIPCDGVYVTRAEVEGRSHPSVTNIGIRPTFDERERVIEAHILDYEGAPLYGQSVHLAFCTRLRDERRFENADALRDQIARDVVVARRWFAGERPAS
jgi:riboflavin kinase/FMN adenylyltransferase